MTLRVDLNGVGNTYRLCFVRAPWAYLTTIDLDLQCGWDKAPYQLHAQLPYAASPDQILKVAFDGPLFPPEAGRNGHARSARTERGYVAMAAHGKLLSWPADSHHGGRHAAKIQRIRRTRRWIRVRADRLG